MLGGVETSGGVLPGQESGDDTQGATNLGGVVAGSQVGKVTRSQEQEGQGQGEEHGGQGNGGTEGGDPENESEDAPGEQEDTERVVEGMGVNTRSSVSGHDVESWNQDGGIRQPESTIGTKRNRSIV